MTGEVRAETGTVRLRDITGAQWRALVATNLSWLFDGYETYALILVVGVALSSSWGRPSGPSSPSTPGR